MARAALPCLLARSAGAVTFGWIVVLALSLLPSGPVSAQPGGGAGYGRIFQCMNAQGKRITSDRPIPDCLTREQKLHGADGTVRGVVPPAMTGEEQAQAEMRERQLQADRARQQDMVRKERQLLRRYPSLSAHDEARLAALVDVDQALALNERRNHDLEAEAKKIAVELAAVRAAGAVPAGLQHRSDANALALKAQAQLRQNLESERERINDRFDEERERLRPHWEQIARPTGAPAPSPGVKASAPSP
jgi:hypothetical protein